MLNTDGKHMTDNEVEQLEEYTEKMKVFLKNLLTKKESIDFLCLYNTMTYFDYIAKKSKMPKIAAHIEQICEDAVKELKDG